MNTLYMKGDRDGQTCYVKYEGTPVEAATLLMQEIGYTNIVSMAQVDWQKELNVLAKAQAQAQKKR